MSKQFQFYWTYSIPEIFLYGQSVTWRWSISAYPRKKLPGATCLLVHLNGEVDVVYGHGPPATTVIQRAQDANHVPTALDQLKTGPVVVEQDVSAVDS